MGCLPHNEDFPDVAPISTQMWGVFILMIKKQNKTSDWHHVWGLDMKSLRLHAIPGGNEMCHRMFSTKITADGIRQAGQMLKQHVNSMKLLIGRIKEKMPLTMNRWKQNVCVCVCVRATISLCSPSQICSPLCQHLDDPEPHTQGNYSGQLPCRREAVPSIKSP